MRTIYITENAEKAIKESLLLDRMPDDIMSAIMNKKTSLGNNPALPDVFDEGFIERVTRKRFEETKEELKKIGVINDVEDTEPKTALRHLIKVCQELERPVRPQLEKICYNYMVNLFDIPDDTLDLSFSLVDKVDLGNENILLDPIDGDDDLEFADIVDAESVRSDVYKRRLLDVLSMGGAMQLSSNIKSYLEDIYEINPRLLDLYRKILALNNYLLFTQEDAEMTEDNKRQIGTVNVTLGDDIRKTKLISQGVVFPILLSETIRGFFELFIAHGLPKNLNRAKTILGKSDFLKMEPWDMRLGPSLWNLFSKNFKDADSTLIPYIMRIVSILPTPKFNFFFKEVFAHTRKGESIMNKILYKAKEQKKGFNDDKSLSSEPTKSIITDEIYPEEL